MESTRTETHANLEPKCRMPRRLTSSLLLERASVPGEDQPGRDKGEETLTNKAPKIMTMVRCRGSQGTPSKSGVREANLLAASSMRRA
jgi:hypothetical protein